MVRSLAGNPVGWHELKSWISSALRLWWDWGKTRSPFSVNWQWWHLPFRWPESFPVCWPGAGEAQQNCQGGLERAGFWFPFQPRSVLGSKWRNWRIWGQKFKAGWRSCCGALAQGSWFSASSCRKPRGCDQHHIPVPSSVGKHCSDLAVCWNRLWAIRWTKLSPRALVFLCDHQKARPTLLSPCQGMRQGLGLQGGFKKWLRISFRARIYIFVCTKVKQIVTGVVLPPGK